MPRKTEPQDDQLKALISEAIGAHFEDDDREFADGLVEDVMAKLRPFIGAAAERRRSEGLLRDAFREGYRTGQVQGRYARWHSLLWRHSALARQLRESTSHAQSALQTKYASLNF